MTEKDAVAAVVAWWREIQPDPETRRGGDRAALARLRRTEPDDAIFDEAALDLYRRLGPPTPRLDERRLDCAIRLALVLAHVREEDVDRDERGWLASFGRRLGRRDFGDKAFETARLKPLRFQRLLNAHQTDDVVREFRRAVDIAGRTANVFDLAKLLIRWDDDRMRARFAFDYFAAGSAAPMAEPETVAGL